MRASAIGATPTLAPSLGSIAHPLDRHALGDRLIFRQDYDAAHTRPDLVHPS